MGSKAKKAEASDAEKANAEVGAAEYAYFKQRYDPLLQNMRDKSLTEDIASGLRGRANADTMQALSPTSYTAINRSDATGDLAQAVSGQMGVANTAAKDVQNTQQTNVLGTARGQVADAQSGMSIASRLGTSEALAKAQAKQDVAAAKFAAAAQVATTFAAQGIDNMKTKGVDADGNEIKGSFFRPVGGTGVMNKSGQEIYAPVKGVRNRLGYSSFFG